MNLARRTLRGSTWAVLAGLVAAHFVRPSIDEWSILVGVVTAVVVDVWYRRREWRQQREREDVEERGPGHPPRRRHR